MGDGRITRPSMSTIAAYPQAPPLWLSVPRAPQFAKKAAAIDWVSLLSVTTSPRAPTLLSPSPGIRGYPASPPTDSELALRPLSLPRVSWRSWTSSSTTVWECRHRLPSSYSLRLPPRHPRHLSPPSFTVQCHMQRRPQSFLLRLPQSHPHHRLPSSPFRPTSSPATSFQGFGP